MIELISSDEMILEMLHICDVSNKESQNFEREFQEQSNDFLFHSLRQLEINPENVYFLNLAGATYSNLGNQKEAIKLLQKAITLNPEEKALWNNLSLAQYRKGDIQQAIVSYRKGLELEQKHGSLYMRTIQYAMQGKTYEEALLLLLEEYPNDFRVLTFLAQFYLKNKKYLKAIVYNYKLLEVLPDLFTAWHNISESYYELGEITKAIQALNRALDINPTAHASLMALAIIYVKQQQYDQAYPLLIEARELYPEDSCIFFHLAFVAANQSNREDAVSNLQKCLSLAPEMITHILEQSVFNDYLSDLVT
jgi:tetratricopeptide (TPR) repeat protein